MADVATFSLLIPFIVTIISAYLIAWFYRNDYDPKKMLIAYLVYLFPLVILGYFLQLGLILSLAIYVFGGIMTIFRNSTYFNQ